METQWKLKFKKSINVNSKTGKELINEMIWKSNIKISTFKSAKVSLEWSNSRAKVD